MCLGLALVGCLNCLRIISKLFRSQLFRGPYSTKKKKKPNRKNIDRIKNGEDKERKDDFFLGHKER